MSKFLALKEFKEKALKGAPFDGKTQKEMVVQEVKTVSDDEENGLVLEFAISSGSIDRDLDTIDPNGWELENFRKNPVMLWAHDSRQPPIGKSIKEWVEDGVLKAQVLFVPKEMSPFAHSIGQMFKHGFLSAVSVGFIGKEYVWVEDEKRPWGIDFKRQELLEFSAVPVPSNPEALLIGEVKGEESAEAADLSAYFAQIKINRNKGGIQ